MVREMTITHDDVDWTIAYDAEVWHGRPWITYLRITRSDGLDTQGRLPPDVEALFEEKLYEQD